MTLTEEILSQQPTDVLGQLRRADVLWQQIRQGTFKPDPVINTNPELLEKLDYDVIISGGTLGILLACALQRQGWRVALLEKGTLRGRDQEWNIARSELSTFKELGLLTPEELEKAITTEYNPARVSFSGHKEIWVKDVLNLGIDPIFLLDSLKTKFLQAGGTLLEKTPFTAANIHPDGVAIQTGETKLTGRLLIDAMGHFSPIAAQARNYRQPDGVCVVVGSCAEGYPSNTTGDLLASFTELKNQCQYFWEAFPARDGRTTYMFTYLDAAPNRPSLEFFMEEYLQLLPQYQQVELGDLKFKRFLFGFFPSYRTRPLKMPWGRILPVGDSCGAQSPVSFGGFGSMVRHLRRLTLGIDEALKVDALDAASLGLLQPYQPNISVTWLFQKTMSVKLNQNIPANQINNLMGGVFEVMEKLGDDILKPFLQDVIEFSGLSQTLPLVKPQLVLPIIPRLGIATLIDWSVHYLNLALYSALYPIGKSLESKTKNLPPQWQYYYHRWLDAWQYGSGLDYHKIFLDN